jgi:hypothetical protein
MTTLCHLLAVIYSSKTYTHEESVNVLAHQDEEQEVEGGTKIVLIFCSFF